MGDSQESHKLLEVGPIPTRPSLLTSLFLSACDRTTAHPWNEGGAVEAVAGIKKACASLLARFLRFKIV